MNEEIEKNKEEVINIISNILDKGSNYVIKSMPINSHIKEILIDVKKVIKDKEFSQILKVAVSFNGGLTNAINLGIDVISVAKKYGNIFGNYIEDFFSNLKNFVSSTEFKKKVYNSINKCIDKVDNFKELCNDWYDAYDNFNLKDIGDIAGKLNKMKTKVQFDTNCINENTIIQNMTELVNRRKKKLTPFQLDICSNLEEI